MSVKLIPFSTLRARLFVLLAISMVLVGCGSARQSEQQPVCYVETRGDVRHINCTAPTPDLSAALCSEVGSGVEVECSAMLAGETCTADDADSWQCVHG